MRRGEREKDKQNDVEKEKLRNPVLGQKISHNYFFKYNVFVDKGVIKRERDMIAKCICVNFVFGFVLFFVFFFVLFFFLTRKIHKNTK